MRSGAVRAATAALLVAPTLLLAACSSGSSAEDLRLPGGPTSAESATPVDLDATVYAPGGVPRPAVILAHGFGGSKADLDERARELSGRGYVVLAYSARGFGTSTGLISMNSPEFEVADASAIIDYLATRDDVLLDGAGDPRVGVAGGSYGGALALLLAGYDGRVDAVASDITWNDLQTSLFGQSGNVDAGEPGVFKSLWTGNFFGVGVVNRDGTVTECGRFTPAWCAAYTDAAARGIVTPASSELMRASSPGSVTDRITAPTLISAGESDSAASPLERRFLADLPVSFFVAFSVDFPASFSASGCLPFVSRRRRTTVTTPMTIRTTSTPHITDMPTHFHTVPRCAVVVLIVAMESIMAIAEPDQSGFLPLTGP